MRPALEHPNVTLLTNARVVKLETNGSGNEVSAVVVEVDGKTERFAADIVVAACGAANTAKLLLASANDQHPNGLANGSDQVGRNYMFHDSLAVLALSEEENPTVFQKTLGLNDFYFGADDFEFPLGNIQMVGKSSSQMYRGEKPGQTKLAPEWTLEKVAKHAIDFWLSTEDLPSPDNRVTLAPDGNVRLAYSETNAGGAEAALREAEVAAAEAEHERGPPLPPLRVHEERDPGRRRRPPGGHVPLRVRPRVVGAEHRLPGPRGRQPLRRRHEHLPEHRRRQSGADGDGELAPGRRPPARAARRRCAGHGSRPGRRCGMSSVAEAPKTIRSTIPARLDRLSWSPFHTRMVAGLGAAWILDGLQITIASSVTGVLIQPDTLDMTSTQVGLIASVYLVGQVVGALYFGRMSDQLGRKRLLVITLLLYLLGTGLAAFTVNDGGWLWLAWFYGTRFIAGMGIGGQYAAINSAIDEMMPSKYRGRVDIWINGSYWAGAILGSFASLFFLNAFAPNVGWRLAFLMGPVLALVVIVVARTLPESPRWLMTHGRMKEAEEALAGIEEACRKAGQELEPVPDSKALELTPEKKYGYVTFLGLVFRTYPKRAILGATLMITQSFLYNAIYFTYGLVLVQFYGVSADKVPLYGLAFAVGNLCGPLILAPLFDSVGPEADDLGHVHHLGRLARGQRLALRQGRPHREDADLLLDHHLLLRLRRGERRLSHRQRDVADRDPCRGDRGVLRDRADLRSVRPRLLRWLIGDGTDRTGLFIGYLIGGAIMVIGGIVELLIGIKAEGKSLEDITKPITSTQADAPEGGPVPAPAG